jgi:acyl-homoserine lactone acylase PvdQ
VEHDRCTKSIHDFFYVEKTELAHPHQYYWNGAWHPMQHPVYSIALKGHVPVRQDVYLTVHGPVLSQDQGLADLIVPVLPRTLHSAPLSGNARTAETL